jgi:PAS domain S-box-containing protein
MSIALSRTRDDLKLTVHDLQRTNEALLTEGHERKQTEKALRRSEGYLVEAQRLNHTGSWAYDPATEKALYWSDEMFRIHGFDPEQGPPTSEAFLERVHPEDRQNVDDVMRNAAREKKDYQVEHRIIFRDGTIRQIDAIGHPVLNRSEEVIEFVGSATDVTERKRAGEALRRSEAYLAESQRLAHTGSWASKDEVITYWSEESFRIWGFDPQEGTPIADSVTQRIHPEDRDRILEFGRKGIREAIDYAFEYRIVLPDGTVKHLHSSGHPVLGPTGEVHEVVGTHVDITERKRAEEERQRLRQLEADLAHLNRVSSMGELSASLAHEVNQPIAAAVTDAKTCLRWLARDRPDLDEARAAASRSINDATLAAEIVKRIRLLFKKDTLQREPVDLNQVIEDMTLLLHSEAIRFAVLTRMELAVNLPEVIGDRVQLQQVLMNLMMNSIQAMKDVDGPRELTIQSQRRGNGEALISVSDTGVGLPPQHEEKIFNAFFTTKTEGTGMGLQISRSIVESHGGRLWAVDNPPRGAKFCFKLPTRNEIRDPVVSEDRTEPADGLQANNPATEYRNTERTTQRE